MNIKTIGRIHSLGGSEAEITVIDKCGAQPSEATPNERHEQSEYNDYIVMYQSVKCHAIFNWFVNRYYVDDVFRRIEQ